MLPSARRRKRSQLMATREKRDPLSDQASVWSHQPVFALIDVDEEEAVPLPKLLNPRRLPKQTPLWILYAYVPT